MKSIKVLLLSALALASFTSGAAAVPLTGRHSHTITLLPDGNLLITGGVIGSGVARTNSVQMYNMTTNIFDDWTTDPVMQRSSHTATLMSDGNVLIAGGFGAAGQLLDTLAVCYSTSTHCKPIAPTLETPKGGHTATLLPIGNGYAGKVLICGGQTDSNVPPGITADCDIFDPANYTVTAAAPNLISPRIGHTATSIKGGKVFVSGGRLWDAVSGAWLYEPMTEMFDPAIGQWTAKEAMLQGRIDHTATAMSNGVVLIAGGYTSTPTFRCTDGVGEECWTYDDEQAWGYTNGHIVQGMGSHGYMDGAELFNQYGGRSVLAEDVYGVAPYRVHRHSAALLPDGSWNMHGGYGNIVRSVITASPVLDETAVFNLNRTGNQTASIQPSSLVSFDLKTTLARPVSGRLTDAQAFFATPDLDGKVPSIKFSLHEAFLRHSTATLDGHPVGTLIADDCPEHNPGDFHSAVAMDNPAGTVKFEKTMLESDPEQYFSLDITTASLTFPTIEPSESETCTGNVTFRLGLDLPIYYSGIRGSANIKNIVITDPGQVYTLVVEDITSGNPTGVFGPLTPVSCSTEDKICHFETDITVGITGEIMNLSADEVLPSTGTNMMGDPVKVMYELTFTADTISVLDAAPALAHARANIVVREMIFSSALGFTPRSNTWKDLADTAVSPTLGRPVFNHTALVTPAADTLILGGRNCEDAPDPDCGAKTFTAASFGTVFVPVYSNESGNDNWQAGGDLTITRAFHTSTVLPDGRILTCGGSDGSAPLASCDIMDPATKAWTPTGSMKYARTAHTATLLPNGNVLVAGGSTPSSAAVTTAEIFYPDTQTWVEVTSMSEPRSNHTATLLPDGNVLVAAGSTYGGYSKTTELYISSEAYWVDGGDIDVPRAQHTATLLKNGNVLLAGGINAGGATRRSEVFNWETRVILPLLATDMAIGRYEHTATLLRDGRVMVAGGSDNSIAQLTAEYYLGGVWLDAGVLAYNRASHRAALLPNGKVMLTGGEMSGAAQSRAESYDPDFTLWSDQGKTGNRAHHTTVVTRDNYILNIGGINGSEYLKSTDLAYFSYHPDLEGMATDTPRQPLISTATRRFNRNDNMTLLSNTSNFHGLTEASGGGAGPANSSFHNPRVYLQQIDNPSGFMLDLSTYIYTAYGGLNSDWQRTLSSITITAPGSAGALPHGWYHVRVAGSGLFSEALTIQVSTPRPVGAPGAITATVHGTSSLTWTWGTAGISGAEGYSIFSATTGVFITTVAFSASSYTQTNLPPNTLTAIQVAPYNIGGLGQLTRSSTYYTLAATPTELEIIEASFETAELEWSANGNSNHTIYEVTEYIDEGPPPVIYTTPVLFSANHKSTSAVITQLTPDTDYFFRVRARNGAGIPSDYSAPVSTVTVSIVKDFGGEAVSSSTIAWKWVATAGASYYEVFSLDVGTGTLIGSPVGNNFLQTGLLANTPHKAIVRAAKIKGSGPVFGPFTAEKRAYTLTVPPIAAAKTFSDEELTSESINVAWRNNDNANSTWTVYNVTISTLTTVLSTATTTDTDVTFNNLSPNVRYSFSVVAVNGDGIASPVPLPLGSIYTLANAPAEVLLDTITMSGASFSWDTNDNSDATIYSLRSSTAVGSDSGLGYPVTTHIEFADQWDEDGGEASGLRTGTTYYFTVTARNGDGVLTNYTYLKGGGAAVTRTGPTGTPVGAIGGTVGPGQAATIAGLLPSYLNVALAVPAGTYDSATDIAIADSAEYHCTGGIPVEVAIFSQNNDQPGLPVTLTINYNNPNIPTATRNLITDNAAQVVLARYNDVSATCLPLETQVSIGPRTVTATLNHFSIFQLMIRAAPTSLANVKLYPNPFYPNKGNGFVTIDQVPSRAQVRIYTLSGEKVWEGTAGTTGMLIWKGVNKSGYRVASGIYLAVIESSGGKKVLKLAVER